MDRLFNLLKNILQNDGRKKAQKCEKIGHY